MPDIPKQLVSEFLAEYRAGKYSRELIESLIEPAIGQSDENAELATRAFFELLIEPLADSFHPELVSLYNRIFAQVIDVCRRDSRGALFDLKLNEFGLKSEADILGRVESLRRSSPVAFPRRDMHSIKVVIILSRVTIGADVAITSVLIERLKQEFPSATMILLGGIKTRELFGGDPRIQIETLRYGRDETIIGRLMVWTELLECTRRLTGDVLPEEVLIIDPDTRLTQLGLLPVTSDSIEPNSRYLFFPSREYASDTSSSVGQLASEWMDNQFGKNNRTYPKITLMSEDIDCAARVASGMKGRRVVALNFGIGNNPAKRVGPEFEQALIASLTRERLSIILDKGAGIDEASRINATVERLIHSGQNKISAVEIREQDLIRDPSEYRDVDVLIWNGRIGMLGAFIAKSDVYIGYDSAGQHIAAALGVPCIDVFAGYGSKKFVDRWSPSGKSSVLTLLAEGQTQDALASAVVEHGLTVLGGETN